ncbi:hypothetical protein CNR22_11040 [Sphingobacteriaceae bacterium]|nr:hypothetical protein CNR22_11040 [Sphingobacteriaceae bacterium]
MLDALQKKLTTLFVKPLLQRYLRHDRTAHYRGFTLLVKPTVFHPAFFFSSGYLSDFVKGLDLKNKRFLEIGCGSGLISLTAYRKGADVSCTDINPAAVECTLINFAKNFGVHSPTFKCFLSDLFENIAPTTYDVVVINPPYFFEEIKSKQQWAWNCGKNGEYFKKLFSGLSSYLQGQTEIYMVLAENCDLKRIFTLAKEFGFSFSLQEEKKIRWENNYIFRVYPNSGSL